MQASLNGLNVANITLSSLVHTKVSLRLEVTIYLVILYLVP